MADEGEREEHEDEPAVEALLETLGIPDPEWDEDEGPPSEAEVYAEKRRLFREELSRLRHIEGLTYRQIAERTGLPAESVQHHLLALRKNWRASVRGRIDLIRYEECYKLDRLELEAWMEWRKKPEGRRDAKLLDVVLKVAERRARLLGLDSSIKIDLSNRDLDRELETLLQAETDRRLRTQPTEDRFQMLEVGEQGGNGNGNGTSG